MTPSGFIDSSCDLEDFLLLCSNVKKQFSRRIFASDFKIKNKTVSNKLNNIVTNSTCVSWFLCFVFSLLAIPQRLKFSFHDIADFNVHYCNSKKGPLFIKSPDPLPQLYLNKILKSTRKTEFLNSTHIVKFRNILWNFCNSVLYVFASHQLPSQFPLPLWFETWKPQGSPIKTLFGNWEKFFAFKMENFSRFIWRFRWLVTFTYNRK